MALIKGNISAADNATSGMTDAGKQTVNYTAPSFQPFPFVSGKWEDGAGLPGWVMPAGVGVLLAVGIVAAIRGVNRGK